MSAPAPGIGHNLPPALERVPELVSNANRWRAERPAIISEDVAKVADDFVAQLRAIGADLDAELKKEIEPFDLEIIMARLRYKDPRALVKIALEGMLDLASRWLTKKKDAETAARAERERLANEAITSAAQLKADAERPGASVETQLAARRAHEAAAAATKAASKAPAKARMKGDYSARALGLGQYWHAEVFDDNLALRAYAKHPKIREAALIAVKRQANLDAREAKDASKAPAGVRFVATEKAR